MERQRYFELNDYLRQEIQNSRQKGEGNTDSHRDKQGQPEITLVKQDY